MKKRGNFMKLFLAFLRGASVFMLLCASFFPAYGESWHGSRLEDAIRRMTLEEKVGQLLMVGVKGTTATSETQRLVKELKLGSIILYSHNVKDSSQIKNLVSDIQREQPIPLFMAVDQEGGSVVRIRQNTQVLPSAMAIGATQSSQLAFLSGKLTAQELRSLGINMNLAPVLDINTNEYNTIIGVRSFGQNPELVSQMGMWYIEGLQSQGVAATAKHFPGHGDTMTDSHYAVPVLKSKLEELESFHLVPFRRAIENGLDAIMTAHISIPALDPSGLPATFSYNLLTNVLRKKLHFEGVILTDDLEMKSIQQGYDIGTAALKAVLAGADIVMISWSHPKKYHVYQTLLEAAKSGSLSSEILDASVKRILKLKIKRGLLGPHRESAGPVEELSTPSVQRLAQQIANHAVTVVFNKNNTLPLQEEDHRRVLLVTPLPRFYHNMKFFHERVTPYFISPRPTVEQLKIAVSEIQAQKGKYDLILFGITHSSQLSLINQLQETTQKPTVVVSFNSPYYVRKLGAISSYVCSYGTEKELLQATAQVISGVIPSQGKLPVTLDDRFAAKVSLLR